MFDKNPAQHYADMEMLEKMPELHPAFTNVDTNCQKWIECIRVDGAADDGSSHIEVQFNTFGGVNNIWRHRHMSHWLLRVTVELAT